MQWLGWGSGIIGWDSGVSLLRNSNALNDKIFAETTAHLYKGYHRVPERRVHSSGSI